jgi:hypothetical protein
MPKPAGEQMYDPWPKYLLRMRGVASEAFVSFSIVAGCRFASQSKFVCEPDRLTADDACLTLFSLAPSAVGRTVKAMAESAIIVAGKFARPFIL